MRTGAIALMVAVSALCAPIVASANAVTVVVDSTDGPWDPIANPAFDYGANDQTAPTVIDAASGIVFTPGKPLSISYLSGGTSAFGGVTCSASLADPNCVGPEGYVGSPFKNDDPGSSGNFFPSLYMPADWDTFLNALVGTFTDATGAVVGTPFEVGFGRTVVIPVGATQLQLGINDDIFSDNTGALTVRVSDVPEPVSSGLLAIGVAALFAARRRRAG